jgi:hypothetical protein
MTSTGNACKEIEKHSCYVNGETYVFEVHSAFSVVDRPGHAVLLIGVFRRHASGRSLAATVRATAPLGELDHLPAFLTRLLQEQLVLMIAPVKCVH